MKVKGTFHQNAVLDVVLLEVWLCSHLVLQKKCPKKSKQQTTKGTNQRQSVLCLAQNVWDSSGICFSEMKGHRLKWICYFEWSTSLQKPSRSSQFCNRAFWFSSPTPNLWQVWRWYAPLAIAQLVFYDFDIADRPPHRFHECCSGYTSPSTTGSRISWVPKKIAMENPWRFGDYRALLKPTRSLVVGGIIMCCHRWFQGFVHMSF